MSPRSNELFERWVMGRVIPKRLPEAIPRLAGPKWKPRQGTSLVLSIGTVALSATQVQLDPIVALLPCVFLVLLMFTLFCRAVQHLRWWTIDEHRKMGLLCGIAVIIAFICLGQLQSGW